MMYKITKRNLLLFILLGLLITLITLFWLYFFKISSDVTNNTIKIVKEQSEENFLILKNGVIYKQLLAFGCLFFICILSLTSEAIKRYILRAVHLNFRAQAYKKLSLLPPNLIYKEFKGNKLFIKLEKDLDDYIVRRINAYFDLLNGWIYIFLTTIFLAFTHWSIALTVILSALLFSFSRSFFTNTLLKKRKEFQEKRGIFLEDLQLYLDSYEMLYSIGKEDIIRQRLEPLFKAEADSRRKEIFVTDLRSHSTNLYLYLLRDLSLGVLFFALIFGFFKSYLNPGAVVIVTGVFFQLTSRFNQIILAPGQLKISRSLLKNVEIEELTKGGEFSLDSLSGFKTISLRGVSLTVGNKEVIKDLNFDIQKNQRILIVGPSGVGKTSLLRLITGFETNYSGKVMVDDKEFFKVKDNIYKLFALSSSAEIIFNDTVINNITLWEEVEEKRLNEILKKVNLKSSYLLRNCLSLSLGQRNKVVLARALILGRPIVVLDETLSALDKFSFRETINNLICDKETTYIFISHREIREDFFNKIIKLN